MAASHLRTCKNSSVISMSETYLFFGNSALRPVVIKNCNGMTSVPFGKAWIDRTQLSKKNVPVTGIPFAFLFKEATDCFLDMILGLGKAGSDEHRPDVTTLDNKQAALACIKKYLTEDFEKHEKCILKLSEVDSEVMVQAILAVHLFAPLTPDMPGADKYGMDKQHFPKDEQQRKCPSCGEKLKFADTSFGNIEVWHGYADMILKKSAVTVNKEYDETKKSAGQRADNYDSDSDASVGSSVSCSSISSVSSVEVAADRQFSEQEAEAEAIAQTITNAFCEESNSDVFIPSFLATNEKVKIYMYCCSKDVLLESLNLPICPNGSLSIKALVLVWLAVNFDVFKVSDVFSEKFRDRLEYELPLSNFHKIVGEDALKLYQYEASRHVVLKRSQTMEDSEIPFHPKFYKLSIVDREMFDIIQLMEKISLIGKK